MSDFDWDEYFEQINLDHEVQPGERLKWGWNHQTGDAEVWAVAGPGDGLPSHQEHLNEAWGREPSISRGDVLGAAHISKSSEGGEPPEILLSVYFSQEVPTSVCEWFAASYPSAEMTVRSL